MVCDRFFKFQCFISNNILTMRKSWSAKGYTNRKRPLLSSTRLLMPNDSSSVLKIKSFGSIEYSYQIPRPTTAGSL
jgi:hypothetical protein